MNETSGIYKHLEGTEATLDAYQLNRELTFSTENDALRYKTQSGDLKYFYQGNNNTDVNYYLTSPKMPHYDGETLQDTNMYYNSATSGIGIGKLPDDNAKLEIYRLDTVTDYNPNMLIIGYDSSGTLEQNFAQHIKIKNRFMENTSISGLSSTYQDIADIKFKIDKLFVNYIGNYNNQAYMDIDLRCGTVYNDDEDSYVTPVLRVGGWQEGAQSATSANFFHIHQAGSETYLIPKTNLVLWCNDSTGRVELHANNGSDNFNVPKTIFSIHSYFNQEFQQFQNGDAEIRGGLDVGHMSYVNGQDFAVGEGNIRARNNISADDNIFVGGDIYTKDWTDYTSHVSANQTGWDVTATSPSPYISKCWYKVVGKRMTLRIQIQGTSNSSDVKIPIPSGYNIYGGTTWSNHTYKPCKVTDNGSALTTPGFIGTNSNTTSLAIFKDWAFTAWTSSGVKTVHAEFDIQLA